MQEFSELPQTGIEQSQESKSPVFQPLIDVAEKAFVKEIAYPTKVKRRVEQLARSDPKRTDLLRQDQELVTRMQPENTARREIMRDVLERLTRTMVDNSEIVHGKQGEAFPVTHVNITNLAKALYQDPEYGNTELPPMKRDEQGQEQRSRVTRNIVEFNFVSAPTEQNGTQFTFTEELMKQTMNRLPSILHDIRDGNQPQEVVVYTLGTPTNRDWGFMPKDYADQINAAPYETIGKSYADYIESVLKDYPDKSHTTALLYGISMGATYAGKTAESLLSDGAATQQQDKNRSIDLPSLQVLMDSPVSFNDLHINGKQLMGMFLKDVGLNFMIPWNLSPSKKAEGIWNPQTVFNPLLTAKLENQFSNWLDTQLRQKGIYRTGEEAGDFGNVVSDPQLKEEQHDLKEEALKRLIDEMARGVPLEVEQL